MPFAAIKTNRDNAGCLWKITSRDSDILAARDENLIWLNGSSGEECKPELLERLQLEHPPVDGIALVADISYNLAVFVYDEPTVGHSHFVNGVLCQTAVDYIKKYGQIRDNRYGAGISGHPDVAVRRESVEHGYLVYKPGHAKKLAQSRRVTQNDVLATSSKLVGILSEKNGLQLVPFLLLSRAIPSNIAYDHAWVRLVEYCYLVQKLGFGWRMVVKELVKKWDVNTKSAAYVRKQFTSEQAERIIAFVDAVRTGSKPDWAAWIKPKSKENAGEVSENA